MTQIEKLYAQLVTNRASVRFAYFRRILEAFGFTLDRVKGSDHIFKHPDVDRALSIQPRGDKAKPYQSTSFSILSKSSGLR